MVSAAKGKDKGKEKVTDGGSKGKRKWSGGAGDDDKTGGKRKNRGVLQFFDDAAYEMDEDGDSSDDSLFDDLEDEFGPEFMVNSEPGKGSQLPFIPKEEELSEEELERMLEERYKPGAGFVSYAEDSKCVDGDIDVVPTKGVNIWRVKCTVGRERQSAFCLMQKFADLAYMGTKLQLISACALDHVKGFILIEAEKQNDIYEACKGISTIYPSRILIVPNKEISRLLCIRSKSSGISEGMWARVKSGKYKGDLAQVIAVKKKVTVKLIPRIDLKAMAEKFGGGVSAKRTAIPPQRLISSNELEEFRPLIRSRQDRDTKLKVDVLDGMMLKDGYLYKKVSIDSLSLWGVMPTEDELLKFEPSKEDEPTDVQWLSQLFGDKKKKEVEVIKQDKGGGKSEGSSSSCVGSSFELHDLVFFGRKDFGVVIASEKDDTVKVLKESTDGPLAINVKQSDVKIASFDKKLFSVLDQHSNTLSVNDHVRVLDGPLKDRQGIVKKIYKGVLFLFDETEEENSGYTCVKAQLCEKINLPGNTSNEKDSEPGPSGGDLFSSPKSPLCPEKSWEDKDNKSNYTHDDNAIFSVGQALRIRVGPLKGYLCRVLAIRRSDVTVKLDSQHKILTVKSDHLSEVRGRNPAIGAGEQAGAAMPFDLLGSQDGARDWMGGSSLPTEDAGGSTDRTSWSSFPSATVPLSKESGFGDPVDGDAKNDSAWDVKAPAQSSAWGATAANQTTGSNSGWGKAVEPQQPSSSETLKDDSWGKAVDKWNSGGETSGSKAGWGNSGGNLGGNKPEVGSSSVIESENKAWGTGGAAQGNAESGGWKNSADKVDTGSKSWDTSKAGDDATDNSQTGGWNKPKSAVTDGGSSWSNPEGQSSWGKKDAGSSWGKQDTGSSWGKQDTGSSWGKQDGGSSGSKPDGGSSWNKPDGGLSSWGTQSNVNAEDKSQGWKTSDGTGGGRGGYGGWSKGGAGNGEDTDQASWGRSKPYDGDGGSGGRRGGRGRGRGRGRDNYGRGRSFDHDQSTGWKKEGQYGGQSDSRNNSSWSSGGASSWSKDNASGNSGNNSSWGGGGGGGASSWGKEDVSGNKPSWSNDGGSSWGKENVSGKNEDSLSNQGSGADKDNQGSGWGTANPNWGNKSSVWGKSSSTNEQATGVSNEQSSWGKETKSDESNKSSWDTSTDGNQSSGWGSQKASEDSSSWAKISAGNDKDGKSSLWKGKSDGDGGSSSGWSQGNWSKSEATETGGNQDSSWNSNGNWKSGNGFGSDNQDEPSGEGGRGGNWRGRGGRGGFRGRGDRGGFGGRGGSGRGDFGGRGGFGRGGFDREGGRGGFRGRGGRGRGDWHNRQDGSNNESDGWKSTGNAGSWSQRDDNSSQGWSSKNQTDGWKSSGAGGSWSQSGSDNNPSQGFGSKNNSDGWKNTGGGGGSWNQSGSDNNASQGWGSKSTGGGSSWNQRGSDTTPSQGWGSKDNTDAGKNTGSGSSWNQKGSDDNPTQGWGSKNEAYGVKGTGSGSWDQKANDSNPSQGWNQSKGETSQSGSGWNQGGSSNKEKTDGGPSGSWGKGGW